MESPQLSPDSADTQQHLLLGDLHVGSSLGMLSFTTITYSTIVLRRLPLIPHLSHLHTVAYVFPLHVTSDSCRCHVARTFYLSCTPYLFYFHLATFSRIASHACGI
jgi:hypothetical protein